VVKREIVWTETAKRQRREILRYWTTRNGSTKYAEKLIKLTAARIKVILIHPESYKSTIYPETRISAMGHFSILYKLTEDQLIITSFWDNRQDPKKLLEIIKPK
jgi:plasmid stabilization system protein ParE